MKQAASLVLSCVFGLYSVLAVGNTSRATTPHEKTAQSQGTNQTDFDITRSIRKQLMDASAMSLNAQNVKIITENRTVTLKGPVDSAEEKMRVVNLAKTAAGHGVPVVDELYVAE